LIEDSVARRGEKAKGEAAGASGGVVDDRVAEVLAGRFPEFSAVEIRECAEFEDASRAADVLAWAQGKRRPYAALRNWARKYRCGYYRRREDLPGHEELQRAYRAFLERRLEEARRRNPGREQFTDGELDQLAREFFAPCYRADMNRISPRQQRANGAGMEAEERA
jgi:hypothetical protein